VLGSFWNRFLRKFVLYINIKVMTAISKPLSNLQLELLKLYSMNIDEKDLLHFKNYLAQFFMQKAIDEADKVWEEKGYNDDLMDEWINEEQQ
jgi:hypothetical protein